MFLTVTYINFQSLPTACRQAGGEGAIDRARG